MTHKRQYFFKKIFILLFTIFIGCTNIDFKLKNIHPNNIVIYSKKINDPSHNRHGNDEYMCGRLGKKADYYRLAILTDSNYYMTRYAYDCEDLIDGNIKVYKSEIGSLLVSLLKCFHSWINEDDIDWWGEWGYEYLKKIGVVIDYEENYFSPDWMIVSGKYIKKMTNDDYKKFISTYKDTIILYRV
jgi:hypothetical protein